MRLRVVCGLGVTMANFSPTSLLSSVDFPTLGRPKMATVPATALSWGSAVGCSPAPLSSPSSIIAGFYIAQESCYPEFMHYPGVLAGLLVAASVGPRAAASPLELVSGPDGFLE